jgi:hypothetical protein
MRRGAAAKWRRRRVGGGILVAKRLVHMFIGAKLKQYLAIQSSPALSFR